MYNWTLNDNQFSILDRTKIAAFFLNPKNFWSQGPRVAEFERECAKLIGSKYAVFCSSGSTANTMLAMQARDKGLNKEKNTIIVPSIGWQTTFSPFIREGFDLKFIDISLKDFCLDLDLLDKFLSKNAHKVRMVFIVSLLGFTPNMDKINEIYKKYKVKICLDNCENTFGCLMEGGERKFTSSLYTSTTSYYMGHCIQACGEGGMIFTNHSSEYEYFLMARNHGMTRSLSHIYNAHENPYRNDNVDSRFDFALLGNNFRGTDVSAFVASLDLKRSEKYIERRRHLYDVFSKSISLRNFILPDNESGSNVRNVPFCLPVILKNANKKQQALNLCDRLGIESRPVVSSNIARHTCYRYIVDYRDFPVAEWIHNNGFYVGLHAKVSEEKIRNLTWELNKI